MRNYFGVCLLLSTILFSCTSNEKVEQDAAAAAAGPAAEADVPFAGYWISEGYYNSIREKGSPREAQENGEFIFIPEKPMMPAMLISAFHEGGPMLSVIKNKDRYEIWDMKDSLTRNRLLSPVEMISERKLKVGGNRVFVKMDLFPVEDDYLVLEEILFKGTYTDTKNNKVEFRNDGTVSGLGDYTYYSPVLDYYDAGMQVDQVGFGTSKDDELDYVGFKFSGNKLEIFELNCLQYNTEIESCEEVAFGKLLYTLYKKN